MSLLPSLLTTGLADYGPNISKFLCNIVLCNIRLYFNSVITTGCYFHDISSFLFSGNYFVVIFVAYWSCEPGVFILMLYILPLHAHSWVLERQECWVVHSASRVFSYRCPNHLCHESVVLWWSQDLWNCSKSVSLSWDRIPKSKVENTQIFWAIISSAKMKQNVTTIRRRH